jgi:hypothetical protein
MTVPPAQPLADLERQPVYRGQAPSSEGDGGRFGDSGRPQYLPEKAPAADGPSGRPRAVAQDGWQSPDEPVRARLGPPRSPPSTPAPGRPKTVSPVGYPD